MCKQITNVEFLVLHSKSWNSLTMCKQVTNVEFLVLHSKSWNNLTVCKQMIIIKLDGNT